MPEGVSLVMFTNATSADWFAGSGRSWQPRVFI